MAGDNSIQVTISNGGTDLTAYLARLKQQATDTNRTMLEDGKSLLRIGSDQLKMLNDQVDALTRLSNLEMAVARRRNAYYREQRQAEMELSRIRALSAVPGMPAGNTTLSGVDRVDWSYTASRNLKGLQAKGSGGNNEFEALLRAVQDNGSAILNAAQMQVAQMAGSTDSIVAAIEAVQEEVSKLGELIPGEVTCSCEGGDGGGGGGGDTPVRGGIKNVLKSLNWDAVGSVLSYGQEAVSTAANAENSFHMIKSTTQETSGLIGGAIGAFIPVIGPALGYAIGSAIGGTVGEIREKQAIATQEYLALSNRISGLQGGEGAVTPPNMTSYGMDRFEVLKLMEQVALKGGTADAARYTSELVPIARAYSLDKNELLNLIELQGTNKGDNKSLTGLVGGLISKAQKADIVRPGDYSGLGDFLHKFSDLQREFLKNQTYVATGTTADIMTKFHGIGGQWQITDPRGMDNLLAVQNGLSHPDADSMKALSFMSLRRLAPNAGLFEIMQMQEQGLSGEHGMEYLQSMLKYAHQLGGNSDMGKFMLKNLFPQLSYNAVNEIYNNSNSLEGATDKRYLESLQSSAQYGELFKSLGASHTTEMERETAEKKELYLKSFGEILSGLTNQVGDAIRHTFSGATIELANGSIKVNASQAAPSTNYYKPWDPMEYMQRQKNTNPPTPFVKKSN